MESDNNDDMLDQSESLDSDEVRNDDGDAVVDPPDDEPSMQAHDADQGGALELVGDDELDRIDPNVHGRERGQIDGTPEDGDSSFDVQE